MHERTFEFAKLLCFPLSSPLLKLKPRWTLVCVRATLAFIEDRLHEHGMRAALVVGAPQRVYKQILRWWASQRTQGRPFRSTICRRETGLSVSDLLLLLLPTALWARLFVLVGRPARACKVCLRCRFRCRCRWVPTVRTPANEVIGVNSMCPNTTRLTSPGTLNAPLTPSSAVLSELPTHRCNGDDFKIQEAEAVARKT